ncbi:PRD domain-containing protein [Clostridium sp. AF18-27]|uniref:Transcriptional antiterminator, BglG family n=1 Tax=Enterocloster lavalensis TaxID=460384 RepID=A0A1I0D748_9FIRM|nr:MULTISPECIES: PRD domain-containing protein [Enterocloster]MBS5604622.1 PRD domain-containing protein [Enterocloster asparagiformis]RHR53477.1 PRD domain-containing protein [Clostridium sp. AF18-27]MCB6345133.1 PRD domain-containing protein [Enterocloster lavalensis]MDR3755269.1 PRD domain-containing protein [Enterocloster sp.]PST35332.1 PRD domain-containing protein [Enterocloster lavalensis]
MEIIRIYNNNVAVVRGDDGKEMIVIGKGLVFQKHAGDLVDETRVEKCFTLQNPRVMTKLEQLIKDMPSIYLSISEEIVEMIRSESDLKLSENIYITLTDHISMSLEREKKGVILGNPFLIEIKQFYKKEFKLAEKAADIIKKHLGLDISEDEIGTITLHIVNASMNQNLENTVKATRMIQDILNIVQECSECRFDEESLAYSRFVRHLQFLAKNLLEKRSKSERDDFMFKITRLRFPEAAACVRRIKAHLEEAFGVSISEAEQGFLIYHIVNLTSEKTN